MCVAGLLYLRWKRPDMHRPIKVGFLLILNITILFFIFFSASLIDPDSVLSHVHIFGGAAVFRQPERSRHRFGYDPIRYSHLLPRRILGKQTGVFQKFLE